MPKPAKISLDTLRSRKREGQRFAMLTCYDYTTARIMNETDLDAILVGDTYGEVCLGYDTTLPVTVDDLITVTAAVRRGAPRVFLVGDMPYLSYQVESSEAVRNAGRFMSEAGCDAVKVEVDRRLADTVAAMTRVPIPVVAHLGLRPQSIHHYGGYKAQGKTARAASAIIEDAKIMEDVGASALLLEAVPAEVAQIITESTDLPVIGCVSGPHCDGQVVVLHDILGCSAGHPPKSVKVYTHFSESLCTVVGAYAKDVRDGEFPIAENSISMLPDELERLRQGMRGDT